jgi:hypothetical protein
LGRCRHSRLPALSPVHRIRSAHLALAPCRQVSIKRADRVDKNAFDTTSREAVRPVNETEDGTRQRSLPPLTLWRAASGSRRAQAEREGAEREWGFRERAVRRAELAQPRPEPRWRPALAARERGFRAEPAQPPVVAEGRGQRAAPQAGGRPGADPRATARRSGERVWVDPRSPTLKRRGRPADRQRRAPQARAPAAPDPQEVGRRSRDRLRAHRRSPNWRWEASGRDRQWRPPRWPGSRALARPRVGSRGPPRDQPRP